MKQYKHKQTGWIAFKRCDNEYNIYTKAENFLFQTAKELIENTSDWEEVKPEPQEEVIEGFVINQINEIGCDYFVKQKTHQMQTPATLILNPKPKKEYVRWVMKEFIDNLKNGHPIYRVLATESDYEKYCHKIKITVEEE
jgi:hypothetical protein